MVEDGHGHVGGAHIAYVARRATPCGRVPRHVWIEEDTGIGAFDSEMASPSPNPIPLARSGSVGNAPNTWREESQSKTQNLANSSRLKSQLKEQQNADTASSIVDFGDSVCGRACDSLCVACSAHVEASTYTLRKSLYSPNWTEDQLRQRLTFVCTFNFLMFSIMAGMGAIYAPAFLNSSIILVCVSLIAVSTGYFVQRKIKKARKKSGLLLFSLAFLTLTGPTFFTVPCVNLLTTLDSSGAWTFWAFVEVIAWMTAGMVPAVYALLLLFKNEVGRARAELTNDLNTTSTTLRAGLLAVARTADQVIGQHSKEMKEKIEAGAHETSEGERMLLDLCFHLGVKTGIEEDHIIDFGAEANSETVEGGLIMTPSPAKSKHFLVRRQSHYRFEDRSRAEKPVEEV